MTGVVEDATVTMATSGCEANHKDKKLELFGQGKVKERKAKESRKEKEPMKAWPKKG